MSLGFLRLKELGRRTRSTHSRGRHKFRSVAFAPQDLNAAVRECSPDRRRLPLTVRLQRMDAAGHRTFRRGVSGTTSVAARTAYWYFTTTLFLLYLTENPLLTLVKSPLSEPNVMTV
jgi:hypothetical protein